jgi:ribonuclease VapC
VIVVDTSALIAIIRQERDATEFIEALWRADAVNASSMTVFEAHTVVLRQIGGEFLPELTTLLAKARIVECPFDQQQSVLAFDAYRRFGRGSGHAAKLNLGDCASYALAKSLDAPLLYKGGDFAHTDLRSALAP